MGITVRMEGADDLHPLWLRHLVEAGGPVVRVADDGGTVVGCAVSLPQPGQWMVDDLQVADARWEDAGAGAARRSAWRNAWGRRRGRHPGPGPCWRAWHPAGSCSSCSTASSPSTS